MSTSETITRTDLTNILNEVLPISSNNFYTKDYTVTTGTSQYDGYYYADINNAVPSGYTPVSVFAVDTSAGQATNVYLDAQFLGRIVRVWSVRASTTATVRVTYAAHSIVVPFEAADHVVEQGTSGIWTYRKWNSGQYECHAFYNFSSYAVNTARGSLYSGAWVNIAFPSSVFTSAPNVTATLALDTTANAVFLQIQNVLSTGVTMRLASSGSMSANSAGYAHIQVVGKWK